MSEIILKNQLGWLAAGQASMQGGWAEKARPSST